MGKVKRKNYGIGSRLWWKAVLTAVLVTVCGIGLCYLFSGDGALLRIGALNSQAGAEQAVEGAENIVLSSGRDYRTVPLTPDGEDGMEEDSTGGNMEQGTRDSAGSEMEVSAGASAESEMEVSAGASAESEMEVSAGYDPAISEEEMMASAGSAVILSEEDEQLELGLDGDSTLSAWTGADLSKPLPEPSISAKTAVVIDINSGRVLYEKNKDEKSYPASITKIMTALLAIEQGDLDKKVKVSPKAVGVEGSSIYLAPGEELPLRDLVYGLMLRSGNDAAVAIAEEIAGGTDPFVEMMNQRALSVGAKNTHFMNPNGLHNENHYTTAYDMALMARQAMHNPAFKEVAKAKSYQAKRGEGKFNVFYNKNKVVYQYSGGTGIKIGYTKTAGRTLVASSERNGMELICVVMGAPDWFNDTYALMDYAYSNYEQVKVADGQRPLKQFPVSGGDKQLAYVGTRKDVYCPVKIGAEADMGIAYAVSEEAKAPVRRWQDAGLLHIYVDGAYCYSEPLYYLEDIGRK